MCVSHTESIIQYINKRSVAVVNKNGQVAAEVSAIIVTGAKETSLANKDGTAQTPE